jgi:hypothetical protein
MISHKEFNSKFFEIGLELLIFILREKSGSYGLFLPSFMSVLPDRLYLVVDEFRFEMLRNSHHLGSKLTTSQLSEVLQIGIICASISLPFHEGGVEAGASVLHLSWDRSLGRSLNPQARSDSFIWPIRTDGQEDIGYICHFSHYFIIIEFLSYAINSKNDQYNLYTLLLRRPFPLIKNLAIYHRPFSRFNLRL